MTVDTSAENIARMKDVLTGSLPAVIQNDASWIGADGVEHELPPHRADPAGYNAVIPGLDALEAWAMIETLAGQRDALRTDNHGLYRQAESAWADRDRLAAEVERLRGALKPLLRHVSLHAMDELIYELNGRIGGWRKTPHMMTLTKAARAALGDKP